MKKNLMLVLTIFCLVAVLTACGQKEGDKKEGTEGGETAEEQTISGTINRLGDYLVLLDGDEYRVFDFGDSVDTSSLEEGDRVTVTYTGTLGSEDPAPVATAIQKEE